MSQSMKRLRLAVRMGISSDIIAAQQRVLELGNQVGLGRVKVYNAVIAVSRMANELVTATGGGSLVFATVKRNGATGLEVTAEPNQQDWSTAASALVSEIKTLMDELEWAEPKKGAPSLVGRIWPPTDGEAESLRIDFGRTQIKRENGR